MCVGTLECASMEAQESLRGSTVAPPHVGSVD